MGISRREFLRTTAGAAAAHSGIAAMRPLSIDDALEAPENSLGTSSEGEIFAGYVRKTSKLIEMVSNSRPATENARLYREIFDLYESAAQYAKSKSDSVAWENPQKLTYLSWQIVARMWQARLVIGQAGINIMKEGEEIRIKGLKPIKSSGRRDSTVYGYLRAIQNYEEVKDIYRQMEEHGKVFPSEQIGLGLGSRGNIAPLSLVLDNMDSTFENAINSHVPAEHENALLKKWADAIEHNYKKTGETYHLEKLRFPARDKLEPYLAGRGFLVRK